MKRSVLFFVAFLLLTQILRPIQASPDLETLDPDGDTIPQEWDLTGASIHWEALSDSSDSSYVYTGIQGEYDFVTLEDTGLSGGETINSITLWFRLYASGSKAREKIQICYKTDGTVYESSPVSVTRDQWSDYSITWFDNGGSAWTITDLNKLKPGIFSDTLGSGEELRASKCWVVVDYDEWTGPSPAPGVDTEILYVNSFDWQYAEWIEVGSEPWLQDSDGDYIYTNVNYYFEALFGFEDSSLTDQIDSVHLYLEMKGSITRDDYIGLSIWNGTDYYPYYQDPDSDSYTWYPFDISVHFKTWESINGAELALAYYEDGSGAQNIYIRRALLNISYTGVADSTPPSVYDIGTNTTYAGYPCLFHARWTDETALSGYIFGTNNTGTWNNETWTSWGGSPSEAWSNVTKTLNSTLGLRVEWEIWANDTSDNWNSTGLQYLITQESPPPTFPFSRFGIYIWLLIFVAIIGYAVLGGKRG